MFKILCVCTGNICRSPTAEGLLRHHLKEAGLDQHIHVDSAGTHSYHIGESPDTRSILVAQSRGISLKDLRARKVTQTDFMAFDLILAMDKGHQMLLNRQTPKDASARIALFLEYAGSSFLTDVPDPYYGDMSLFEEVFSLIDEGAKSISQKLKQTFSAIGQNST